MTPGDDAQSLTVARLGVRLDSGDGAPDQELEPAALLSAAVEANVQWVIRQLRESPEVKAPAGPVDVKLVGAIYDLATGRVRFLG